MADANDTNIQIVLNVKEGTGFSFLNAPFLVSASLNSQKLETDPVSPCSNPVFECELVWELDRKYLTNLRLHNMPIKVEVSTIGLRDRRERVGYMVLSLPFVQPSAPPRPVTSTWHKLLGFTGQGKHTTPQILLSLSIEDRKDMALMATEATICNNESARSVVNPAISVFSASVGDMTPTTNFSGRKPFVYHENYLFENMRPLPPMLVPRLCCDEGIIQIGPTDECKSIFSLSFFIGCAEGVDLLMPDKPTDLTNALFYVNYSAFSHSIQTERYTLSSIKMNDVSVIINIQFNQRTSLRLCSSLTILSKYFTCCPYVTVKLFRDTQALALSNIDLRKMVPTDNLNDFLNNFCNNDKTLSHSQRCYFVCCSSGEVPCASNGRKPFIDIQMDLKYISGNADLSLNVADAPAPLMFNDCLCKESGNAKTALSDKERAGVPEFIPTADVPNVGDVPKAKEVEKIDLPKKNFVNESKQGAGDTVLPFVPSNIQEFLKEICNRSSFQLENEASNRTLSLTLVKDMPSENLISPNLSQSETVVKTKPSSEVNTPKSQATKIVSKYTQSDIASDNKDCATATDDLPASLAPDIEHQLVKKVVEELEEWKEKQQELFKAQLKCKEDRRLEFLSNEWMRKRTELEETLKKGVEQCKQLAIDLTVAREELRLRGCDTKERQKRLSKAKQALEVLYNNKYQDLRLASKQLEEEYQHNLKASERKHSEQEEHIKMVERENMDLKEKLSIIVHELEKIKRTGLTKDQTADLLQELRAVEEKLETAEQSKQFFKEQWSKAVHEIHVYKLQNRRQMQEQLQEDRQHIEKIGLERLINNEQSFLKESQTDLKKLKDDLLGGHSSTSSLGSQNGMSLDMASSIENSIIMDRRADKANFSKKEEMNDQLNSLIEERDCLLKTKNRDEAHLTNLTQKIRNLLITRSF